MRRSIGKGGRETEEKQLAKGMLQRGASCEEKKVGNLNKDSLPAERKRRRESKTQL